MNFPFGRLILGSWEINFAGHLIYSDSSCGGRVYLIIILSTGVVIGIIILILAIFTKFISFISFLFNLLVSDL